MKKILVACLLQVLWWGTARAGGTMPVKSLAGALSAEQWSQVEHSVDHALVWLAAQEAADGSFPTRAIGQPGVTSLCVMAFLSRGHQPGFGPYGKQLDRAIDYVLDCQMEDGLFSFEKPAAEFALATASQTASYNHAIAGLMLGEAYGHIAGARAKRMRAAITKAIQVTRALQTRSKPYAQDVGGIRYVRPRWNESDADLSVTAWHIMFLRSARNAEFNVPQKYIDDGVSYIRRCWNPDEHMFNYIANGNGGPAASRGMTGAGILSLSLAGEHNTGIAIEAGNWLVAHPYGNLGDLIGPYDRFYYSAYYCSQAAAQLGGKYWEKIFPPLVNAFLKAQNGDGSFPLEPKQDDAQFGQCYTTAIAVLAMTPAYQLLPVYQR
jgi:prenyltransferase beta subunit